MTAHARQFVPLLKWLAPDVGPGATSGATCAPVSVLEMATGRTD
jgi:hypothetical protein